MRRRRDCRPLPINNRSTSRSNTSDKLTAVLPKIKKKYILDILARYFFLFQEQEQDYMCKINSRLRPRS